MEVYSILVFVCISLSSCYAHVLPPNCENGGISRHPQECRRWYKCDWGKWIEMPSCGPGMVFSNEYKTCLPEGFLGAHCTPDDDQNTTTSTPATPPATPATPESCSRNHCQACRGGSLILDLNGGDSPDTGNMPPGVTIIQAPTANSSVTHTASCSKMALIKVNFQQPNDNDCQPLLKVELELGEDRNGRMFNFGDSSTNNGAGGDGHTQENDAEIDNYHATGIRIETSGKCNSDDLHIYPNATGDGVAKLTVWIGNGYCRITNDAGLDDEKCDSCLLAPSGQIDDEGSVNKEVYFAFNRVVSYPSPQDGYGVCKATISWDCAPSSLLPCEGDHCVPVSAQYGVCFEIEEAATNDCRWKSSFDRRLDEKILNGTIIAYKIQWSDGSWTGWYSPHHGDIDHKLTDNADCPTPIYPNSLRRLWAYFYDHNHKYIICK